MWQDTNIRQNELSEINCGDLHLKLKLVGDEIWSQSTYTGDSQKTAVARNQRDIWSRWVFKDDSAKIQIKPALPNRPVVVRPENTFRLLPATSARIYVRVPLWAKLSVNKPHNFTIADIPTVILSDTWFGSHVEGELCYWISSSTRRKITNDLNKPFLTICPLELKNNSDEELLVEKLCLRVGGLSLFQGDDEQIWSNETKIAFRGSDNISEITITKGPPKECKNAKLLSEPRESLRKSFSARTFYSLFNLSILNKHGNITYE